MFDSWPKGCKDIIRIPWSLERKNDDANLEPTFPEDYDLSYDRIRLNQRYCSAMRFYPGRLRYTYLAAHCQSSSRY